MEEFEVDIDSLAEKAGFGGINLELAETDDLSHGRKFYRFAEKKNGAVIDEHKLFFVTDGGGGYEAFFDPLGESPKQVRGHISETFKRNGIVHV